MKKISISLIAIFVVITMILPVFAETITENPFETTIDVLAEENILTSNFGTVSINNGTIEENRGTVSTNNNKINNNYFEVTKNEANAVIEVNTGKVDQNNGTINTNNEGGIVYNSDTGIIEKNYAAASGGTIKNNFSKDVASTKIENNFSEEVGTDTTVTNQYYKLNIVGDVTIVCAADTNSNVADNIFTDVDGQTWVRAENAMFTIKAKDGYSLKSFNIATVGNTVASREGAVNFSLQSISGEVTITAEVEENIRVEFNANGGIFENKTEFLIFEKWSPEDYETLEKPTRDGYKFVGYFTEKDGGTSFDNYFNEAGVDQDMTLYAHWEINPQASISGQPQAQPEPVAQPETPVVVDTNPKTGDNIIVYVFLLIGTVISTFVIRKNK